MVTIRGALTLAAIMVCTLLRGDIPAQAQQSVGNSAALARRAVTDAQNLQLMGEYDAARRLLTDAIGKCSFDPRNTRECRGRINYGLGYVTQLQATSVDTATEQLANDALRSYRAVLADFPAHADALKNIWVLYSRLGGARLNPAQLTKAAEEDPARRSGYLTLLGDHFAAKGDAAAARVAYRDAIQAAPADVEPRRQLLSLFDISKPGQTDSVFRQIASLEARFPDLAADEYAALLAGAQGEMDRDRALVRWVSLQTARGQSPQAFIDELPARVLKSKAGVDLRAYVKEPWVAPAPGNWWLGSPEARVALARVGLQIGEQMLAVEKPGRVEKCWTIALGFTRETAPVSLDLQRNLALLYDGHPELDPTGAKFTSVEERIFREKGVAIREKDLWSEQRYHSTLGLIYAQRKQWRGNDYAHDAMYQLNAARRTAADRDREDGTYQPLALIKELLATGYAAIGDAGASRAALVDAVRSYLDLDDITRATTLLDSARVNGPDAEALRFLIRVRARAGAETDARCPPRTADAFEALGSNAGFAQRQRFKLNADCAVVQSKEEQLRSATQALTAVLSARFALIGANDLRRLNQVRAIILNRIGLRAPELEVYRGAPQRVADEQAQAIAVSLDDAPAYILLPAAEVKRVPRPTQ